MPEKNEVDLRSNTQVPGKCVVKGCHNDLWDDTLQCKTAKEVQERTPARDVEMLQWLQLEYRDEAPLFRRLSENFELCVMGFNLVKQDLENLQRECSHNLKQALHTDPQ